MEECKPRKNQKHLLSFKMIYRYLKGLGRLRTFLLIPFMITLLCPSFQLQGQELEKTTRKEVISEENEFGGRTIEYTQGDYSKFTEYYDTDGNKAKEETIYSNDYPIDNNLRRLNVYYFFGKKTQEERIYTSSFASRTLVNRSIDHFDRNTGELVRRENHFVRPFTEFNVIYRENGKKSIIEWHYPDNIDGIKKNVSYLDVQEQVIRTETFYTDKTAQEEGYFKRIYYSDYNVNEYKRKSRQEWFYTKEYSEEYDGIAKKVELFHYSLGRPVRKEIIFYDKQDKLIKRE